MTFPPCRHLMPKGRNSLIENLTRRVNFLNFEVNFALLLKRDHRFSECSHSFTNLLIFFCIIRLLSASDPRNFHHLLIISIWISNSFRCSSSENFPFRMVWHNTFSRAAKRSLNNSPLEHSPGKKRMRIRSLVDDVYAPFDVGRRRI